MRPASIAESSLWSNWSLDRATAIELAAHLNRTQPKTILEAGSGLSTIVLAEYAAMSGATVLSLDHDQHYAQTTRNLLANHNLDQYVTVRYAPITPTKTPNGNLPWYQAQLPTDIDFCLIDGPPGTIGRGAAMHAIHPNLNPKNWEIWLDDADRPAEQAALHQWAMHISPLITNRIKLPHGLATIRPNIPQRINANQITITILTGRRPQLLAETIRTLEQCAPGLLETAHIVAMNNGGDEETQETLDQTPIDKTIASHRYMSLGEAMAHLTSYTISVGNPYWLHLEDDWKAATTTPATHWLTEAIELLQNPKIGQVRLRHRSQHTKPTNLHTKTPINWERTKNQIAGCPLTGNAHYTCNPALMRTTDISKVWPATGENRAIQRYAETGLQIAQLDPGIFHHIGDHSSLERPKTRKHQTTRRHTVPQRNPIATPRSLDEYEGHYQRGGWAYDLQRETKTMKMIADLAGWNPGETIHEIGAGMGEHSNILAQMGYEVTAVERAMAGTTATRENYPRVHAVNADVSTWTPAVKGHIFARGMSWFHWELDGINACGVNVPEETRALMNRALQGTFVLQIWTNLSGDHPAHRVHDNTLDNYHRLFDPLFGHVAIYDWSGKLIVPGVPHDRGVIVIAQNHKTEHTQ